MRVPATRSFEMNSIASRLSFNVLQCARRFAVRTATTGRVDLDPVQVGYLNEPCILVDEQDRVIGRATKAECHRKESASLHRAFSVFLFNSRRELLLQERSAGKITFPSVWTNTCCSHPLHVDAELQNTENFVGIRRAAIRKLTHELNIVGLEAKELDVVGRIIYKADSDDQWMEHELDYLLVGRNFDSVVEPNLQEVSAIQYVDLKQLEKMFENRDLKFSPWFSLLHSSGWLKRLWSELDDPKSITESDPIHKFN
ncbi:Isopentenyl-diphosphate Delta-isomerase [Aphelenchoides besseyi]|nr:Isopentenyl-diphosphate Delta-isomerase [Aphelenchoides besseyi]